MKNNLSLEDMSNYLFANENNNNSQNIEDLVFGTLQQITSDTYVCNLKIDWYPGIPEIQVCLDIANGCVSIEQHLAFIDCIHEFHGAVQLMKIGVPKLVELIKDQGDYGDIEPTVKNVLSLMKTPKLVFSDNKRRNMWGIKMESDIDPEHGYSIYMKDRVVHVGGASDFF